MNKKIKTDAVDSLFDAVLCLQSREECYSFFEDLCTVNELLSLSQRFEVAAMFRSGLYPPIKFARLIWKSPRKPEPPPLPSAE